MVHSSNESQQTRTFSIDHENVLPDHYRLIELIGRGGMAEVYLAEDRRLGRKVAIKFLSSEFRRDPDRVRRFRQEARSASALNHPNILIIHDIGDRNDVQFIVSEYVEGETLGLRIAQGRVPFAEAVEIAIQVASALMAAHAAGIVHRDIKPDNIMIRNDGVVKVLDFGLAKARGFTTANGSDFDALTIDSGSTSPGLIVGTPQYMSPEQARGKELDGRTDIFSLGIIIFEMITRHSPFAGGSFADTMAAILTKEPRRIEEFVENAPARLIAIVDKCLRKDRDERFASMAEVDGELKLLRTEVISTPKDTAEIDPAKSDRTEIRPTHEHSIRRFVSNTFQKPSPIAAVIILVAGALLAGGWWAWDRISLRATAPSLMRTVPITSWSSSSNDRMTSASFSPDGKMIAFAAKKGDSTEIWVKPVVGGDPVQVTKNGGRNHDPVWSSDGQEIAFLSSVGNSAGLWRIPFTGGTPTRILGDLGNGTRLVYWSKEFIYFQTLREFLKVSESGSVLPAMDFSDIRFLSVEISPDERLVAYSAPEESGWKVKLRDLSGGPDREIAETSEQIDNIAWHPSSTRLFCSFLVEGSMQVFEVPIDGSGAKQRSNGDINFLVHDVAPNGSVLYGTLNETSDLWSVDTSTNRESIVANEVASEFWPDVSNDGSIAYQSVNFVDQPQAGTIKLVKPDTSADAVVASPLGMLSSWSNNGEWIGYSRVADGRSELWKARPNGVDVSRISDRIATIAGYSLAPYLTTSTSNIAWSPDDSKIAFSSSENGDSRLWIASTDGSGAGHAIENDPGLEESPHWTKDGKTIVFQAKTGSRPAAPDRVYRILIGDAETLGKRPIFESREPLRLLGLSENGRSVVVASNPNTLETLAVEARIKIFSVSLETGQAVDIVDLHSVFRNNIHLSRSGDLLAFVTSKGDRTAISTMSLKSLTPKEHVVINDPKILISSLGMSRDGSFIVFGKQTRTNLLSMLTN